MRYQRNDGTMTDGFPHRFGPGDFRQLEALLDDHRVIPLRNVAWGARGRDTVSMRHDVDHNLEHALKFARWEASRCWTATYFLLHTAWYWEDRFELYAGVRELLHLGHEVGLHANAVARARDDGPDPGWVRAAGITCDALDVLNTITGPVPIEGSAAHGDIRCDKYQVHNNDLYTEQGGVYTPEDFGLVYEAYFLHRDAHYLSDSGGRWSGPLEHHPTRRTTMLIHPCHWDIDAETGGA